MAPSLTLQDLSRQRRIGILFICCMSLFIVGLDNTIVNVALPSIGRAFQASVSGLQWTVDAYTLVLASFLMLSGSTADRIGRRKTFQFGLLLFASGSLACSLSPNLGFLIAFRMMQAVGGSMLNPVALSIITNTFTEPRERAQAIGIWGAVVGISLALGPIIGGALVSSVGWRSIFWINVPIGIAALVLAGKFIPESRAAHARRVDPPGQVLIVVFLGTLTYGIIQGPSSGWFSLSEISIFAIALISLGLLGAVELRRSEPLIDLRFFRSIPFSGATIVAIGAFVALSGFLFLNTLYLQSVRGLSPLDAGLDTLPMAAMSIVCAPLSGRLVGTIGPRFSLLVGGAGLGLGALLLVFLTPTTSFAYLFLAYVIFGIGFGFINAPITNTAVSGMPRAQAGVAAAVASTSRQVGQSLGVAIVGALAAVGSGSLLGKGFTSSTHASWLVMVVLGAVIVTLGIVTTTTWARQTAERTATKFGQ
jgi:EmrB/QacA subfamily drug resistance transporter